MQIQIKIFGEDQDLVSQLSELGYEAKLVKGAVVAENKQNSQRRFIAGTTKVQILIPEIIREKKYVVQVLTTENGGGLTNRGSATIVASEKGEKLKPYFVPTRGNLANGDHAFFALQAPFVTVEVAGKGGPQVTINKWEVKIQDGTASIQKTEIWKGNHQELPQMFSQYEPAVKAGIAKSRDYHCRTAYYIQSK